jgi:alkylhydroperoxidase family enzyme
VAIKAVTAALDAHPQVGEARFWRFDERAYDAFADALGALGQASRTASSRSRSLASFQAPTAART